MAQRPTVRPSPRTPSARNDAPTCSVALTRWPACLLRARYPCGARTTAPSAAERLGRRRSHQSRSREVGPEGQAEGAAASLPRARARRRTGRDSAAGDVVPGAGVVAGVCGREAHAGVLEYGRVVMAVVVFDEDGDIAGLRALAVRATAHTSSGIDRSSTRWVPRGFRRSDAAIARTPRRAAIRGLSSHG